jgi:hypothetical protein
LTGFGKLLIAIRKGGFNRDLEMEVGQEIATTTPPGVNGEPALPERDMIIQPGLVFMNNLSNGKTTVASPKA